MRAVLVARSELTLSADSSSKSEPAWWVNPPDVAASSRRLSASVVGVLVDESEAAQRSVRPMTAAMAP